jgi:hypothetical protein
MLIPIIFSDSSPGQAKPEELDELIRKRKIISFHRSDRWARVGLDPVRGEGGKYKGPERRNSL